MLVDDHHLVRRGIQALLEAEPDIRIIGQSGDGKDAIELVKHLQPGILLLDLMMGGMNGLEVTREVVQRSPHTRIIILSMYGNEAYVREAIKAGAMAYVVKDAPEDELLRAIHEVAAGRRYISSPLPEALLLTAKRQPGSAAA